MRLWCRIDGDEHEELYPSEDAARKALQGALERHKAKGRTVREREAQPHPEWIVEDADGDWIGVYQLID